MIIKAVKANFFNLNFNIVTVKCFLVLAEMVDHLAARMLIRHSKSSVTKRLNTESFKLWHV